MTTAAAQFPDVERMLLDLLESEAPTVTETPADFAPPMIRVQRVGGSVDRLGITDRARVEVACYGTTRDASRAMNERIRQRVLGCAARSTGGVFVDRVAEDTAPVQVPYEAVDTRRVVATFIVSCRRQ